MKKKKNKKEERKTDRQKDRKKERREKTNILVEIVCTLHLLRLNWTKINAENDFMSGENHDYYDRFLTNFAQIYPSKLE